MGNDLIVVSTVAGLGLRTYLLGRADMIKSIGGNDTINGGADIDLLAPNCTDIDADHRFTLAEGGITTWTDGAALVQVTQVEDLKALCGAGEDYLGGRLGDDLIDGGAGADWLTDDGGVDTLSYRGSLAGVAVRLATKTASGGDATGDAIINGGSLRT